MSNDHSEHIERLLMAQRAARQAPEVTEEQKRMIAMLKPIYEFAIQMKATGIIKDVADPDFLHPTCLIPLDETNTRIHMSVLDGEMRPGLPRGYLDALQIFGQNDTHRGKAERKHFNVSNYDDTDGLYADVFRWITGCIAEDIRLKPKC